MPFKSKTAQAIRRERFMRAVQKDWLQRQPGPRGVATTAASTPYNLPVRVDTNTHPAARSVTATARPLSLREPSAAHVPTFPHGARPQIAFRPIADYRSHRELQTNSHIALLAHSFSTTQGDRPVETQVGWNPRTRRIIIAQNDRTSASNLLAGIQSGAVFSHARNLARTPTPAAGTNYASQLAEEAGSAAKKIWAYRQSPARGKQAKIRKAMIADLWAGRIDVVTSGATPHAERQIAPLVPLSHRDDIAGTKLRCATCALAMGTHSVGHGHPVTGPAFPRTAGPSASYRGRTLMRSVEQTTTGITRARSTSPHK